MPGFLPPVSLSLSNSKRKRLLVRKNFIPGVFLALLILSACGTASLFDRIGPNGDRDWLCFGPGRSWVYTIENDGQAGYETITNQLVPTTLLGDGLHLVFSNANQSGQAEPRISAWYPTKRGWRQHLDLLLALPPGTSNINAEPRILDLPFIESPLVAGTSMRTEAVQKIEGFLLPPELSPVRLDGLVTSISTIEETDIVQDAAKRRFENCITVRTITEVKLITTAPSGPWTSGDIIQYSRKEALLWLAPDVGIIRFEIKTESRDLWNIRNRSLMRGELAKPD